MIFVAVGNVKHGFRRLLDTVDALAGQGIFNGEPVFIQSGNNPDFKPLHCKHKQFLSMKKFEQYIEEASLIICHAGCGTLIHALRVGKVPVAIPRRKKYGEHIDDHQIQLVEVLAEEKRIVVAFEPENLPMAISEARKRQATTVSTQPPPMFDIVRKAIHELIEGI
jgi:UDP-N-acetylglucosamine transferase subunit ALG13